MVRGLRVYVYTVLLWCVVCVCVCLRVCLKMRVCFSCDLVCGIVCVVCDGVFVREIQIHV